MTLLSPLALLFGLTALVPLILHLYQQRQRTVMLFSTNRFFTESIVRSQRRLRLRRLLLLLLRMAACLLLALALAQPILSLVGFGGGGDRDLVVLLDDSLSMQAADARVPVGESRFEQARRFAVRTLDELVPGDRAAVVTFSGRVLGRRRRTGIELSGDRLGLVGEVEGLEPTSAGGDAHAGLACAEKLFRGAEQRNRLLLILTDLQETDWRHTDWPQPQHPVRATLVGLEPPTENNVAIDQFRLSEGTAVMGQPNLLRVRIMNHRPDATPAQLVLDIDDKEHVRRPIDLPGQSRHVEQIPIVFDEPGEHRIIAHVDYSDALSADNTKYATVTVHRRLSVLLVDGESDVQHGRPAAFFLRTAMQAVSAEGDSAQVVAIKPGDLATAKLDRYRVVMLCNVKDLPLPQVGRLEQFVQAGGGLAIFLGGQIDRPFYNNVMGASSRPLGGLLPAELRSHVGVDEAAEPMHILEAELDHPVLQRFKGTLRSTLAGVNVYQAYAVVPREAWVIASMEKQLPFMIERSYGQGKVILFTTVPHPQWTNLPLRRVFMPLLNRTASYLAGGGTAGTHHELGRELVVLRGGWDVDQPIEVTRPDGAKLQASVKIIGADPVAYLAAEQVNQAGFYDAGLPRGAKRSYGNSRHILLAVNVPARESVCRVLDLEEARNRARDWQLKTIPLPTTSEKEGDADQAAIAALLKSGQLSRGIWDMLLWVVLGLVLIEPFVANRIGAVGAAEAQYSDKESV